MIAVRTKIGTLSLPLKQSHTWSITALQTHSVASRASNTSTRVVSGHTCQECTQHTMHIAKIREMVCICRVDEHTERELSWKKKLQAGRLHVTRRAMQYKKQKTPTKQLQSWTKTTPHPANHVKINYAPNSVYNTRT
jgi:hypothetical protein